MTRTIVKETTISSNDQIPLVAEEKLSAFDRPTGYKAIVDQTNMSTLCIVRNNQHFIQHKTVFDELQKMKKYDIKKAMLLRDGIVLVVELGEHIPLNIEIFPEDEMECRAYVMNVYDKARGLSVLGGGFRLTCTNQLTAMERSKRMNVDAYGTSQFSDELEELIQHALASWTDDIEIIREAKEKVFSVKDVIQKHSFLPKKHIETITGNLHDQEPLFNIWNEYTRTITHDISPILTNHEPLLSMQKRANKILAYVVEE
jgi:hypothetical protein